MYFAFIQLKCTFEIKTTPNGRANNKSKPRTSQFHKPPELGMAQEIKHSWEKTTKNNA
jgi:hypothetical protein